MKFVKIILLATLLFIFVWGVYYIMARQGDGIKSAQQDNVEIQQEPTPLPPSFDNEALQTKLQEVLDQYPTLETAVAVQSTTDNQSVAIDADAAYTAASTTKVIVATYALKQIEQGAVSFTTYISGETLQAHLEKMIGKSDNDSWKSLLEYFGYKKIGAYANENGAPSFDAIANTIPPQDMANFLKNLQAGSLINQENVQYLENLMKESYTGPIALSDEHSTIIRKAGWLGDRAHLVGVITSGDKAVSYAIYTKTISNSAYPFTSGSALINELLSAITDSLQI